MEMSFLSYSLVSLREGSSFKMFIKCPAVADRFLLEEGVKN